MAHKILDLNGVDRSTLELVLPDIAKTTLHIGMPTEGLMQELQAIILEMKDLESGDRSSLDLIYDLGARLMSRNREYIKITVEDLRGKYRVELEDMMLFFSAYLDFISTLTNEKN